MRSAAIDEEHLVAHAAARGGERDPRPLLGHFGNLVVAAERGDGELLYPGGGTMDLQHIAHAHGVVLDLHLRDLRLEKVVDHHAHVALHRLRGGILRVRELVDARPTEVEARGELAVEHRLGLLHEPLGQLRRERATDTASTAARYASVTVFT